MDSTNFDISTKTAVIVSFVLIAASVLSVQHVVDASWSSVHFAFWGSLAAVFTGWSVHHALSFEKFDWFSAGLTSSMIWVAWSGMITDVGIYQVAQNVGGLREVVLGVDAALPFYTAVWFKTIVATSLIVGGAMMRRIA